MHHFAFLFLGIIPLSNAAPTSPQLDIHVVWVHDKTKSDQLNNSTVLVLNSDETALLGQSCTNAVNTGNFASQPITVTVNSYGSGSIKYGDMTYKIHSNPDVSGGIVCGTQYNEQGARTDCILPWKGSGKPTESPLEDIQDCFTGVRRGAGESRPFARWSNAIKRKESGRYSTLQNIKEKRLDSPISHLLDKRVDWCIPSEYTVLVDDGAPHQVYFNKQLSENIDCGNAIQCVAGHEQSMSYSISFSADIQVNEWISGGFGVEVSWETGNNYECIGASGDVVCVWYRTAHTAYTVRNAGADCLGNSLDSDPFELRSPNQNNKGGGYYCVIGAQYCRSQGEGYWDWNGPAGGP